MKNSLTIFIIIFIALSGWAQWNPDKTGTKGYVSTGVSFQRWTFEGDSLPVWQVTAPVTFFYPINSQLYVSFSNSPATTQYDQIKLEGLSDTWLRATYVFAGEMFMIHAGVSAPTGKKELTEMEFGLSQILSENVFQFRLPNYGQGFSAKLGAAFAYPVQKGIIMGVGLSHIQKSAYSPFKKDGDFGSIEYQPGSETTVSVGFDAMLGKTGKLNLDAVYTLYGTDKLKVEQKWKNVYNSGNKLLINSTVLVGIGETLLWTNIHWRQKGKNEYWKGTDLESVTKRRDGNQFEVDLMWQMVKWKRGMLSLLGDGRFYSKNEDGEREAKIMGGGAGLSQRLSSKGSFQINIKYLQGTLKSVKNVTVKGIDLSGSLVFEI